jgi:RNA polymerase sigma factor (sigma-70 family)
MTMTTSLRPALHQLHRLMAHSEAGADAQLLERFRARRDESAFELLVWRHGPMVLGVCRRLLGDRHDAEDAFQATFLVLARKAGSIGRGGSVASWLYKVAYRVALRSRSRRRARPEVPALGEAVVPDPRTPDDPGWRELRGVLDEELARLPEKYRAPVVLCYLEELTNVEAARRLRCPPGTVKTRLAHARRLLAARLTARGLGLGAGLVAAGVVPAEATAAVSPVLVGAAVGAVLGSADAVSTPVAALMEGVCHAMFLTKLKLTTAVLAAGLAVAGAGVVSYRALADEPGAAEERPAARVRHIKQQIADLQDELRRAEEAAAREKLPDRSSPVAVIFGDVPITRADMGEHLLHRMRKEQLQAYVNRRILEHACRERGITVTEREIEAALAREMETLGGGRPTLDRFLINTNKTLLEWKEDVIRPRLMMRKLCQDRVHVTERLLRRAFEAEYGEKVECQMVLWPKEEDQPDRIYLLSLDRDDRAFELAAGNQRRKSLAVTNGRIPPFGRHGFGNSQIEKAAFSLRPGEVSPPLDTPEGMVVLKCLRRLPADRTKEFEDVRADLERMLREHLLILQVPKVFEELQARARPRLLWEPGE